ncbi:MAG TPA: ABC transporter ATP-binding protein [Actinomycetota bacterium]|nr:ABC transporter ATP-binding protein [Actinomycetota bacterium]
MALAIGVRDVSKRFRLYHERATSLKERVIAFRRRSYEEFWALRDVSLEIPRGETVGLIGPNGSGKSTLLKLIAGILRPTSGIIETSGRLASLLELGAGFHPDLTGRENVYMNASILGLSRKETDRYFDEIVGFSELEQFIDMQVKHYSSGMYVRLGFSVAVHVDPEIILIDEVLAVGDERFQERCLEKIRGFQREGRTIVFVTHAVDMLRQICSRGILLNQGRVSADGKPNEVILQFRRELHGDAPLSDAPYAEHGTGDVRFEEISLHAPDGAPQQIFHPGEPMELRVRINAQKPVEDPRVGMAFYDTAGRHLFGTNTGLHETSVGTLQGSATASFKFSALPLLEGAYRITLSLHSPDETTQYHWLEKAYAFRVVNTISTASGGPFYFPCTATLSRD